MNTPLATPTGSYRVVAPSSREALRLVREKLGPDAIILSNKVIAEGIEIMAAVEQPAAVSKLVPIRLAVTEVMPAPAPALMPIAKLQDTARLPSTASDDGAVLREIHSMRGMIEEQLAGIAWSNTQRRDPVRGHLLRTLLGAGFSARLSKDVLADLATGQSYAAGLACVKAALERQLPVLDNEDALMDEGGVYALMGPTGVGKTTTTAKLAARCVVRFGPEKLALVTTDSYRIGAYEQLRIYGQILGVSVHAVRDAADLELVLSELRDKHMVLIDTVGMSQRDRAVTDQIAMLCSASRPVKRLLLLNACSHGDTLNEVVQAYQRSGPGAGMQDLVGCIFTKVDEATHPGALLDMAIRYKLPVHYVSNGQKVPENLVLGNRQLLVDSVFEARSTSALFVPGEADMDERPAALRNDPELQAAQATSERLRSRCHQLIRALTHNAQQLTTSAAALSCGDIGFDETWALWLKLQVSAATTTIQGQTQTQSIALALAQVAAGCEHHVLLLDGEVCLSGKQGAEVLVQRNCVLLSDRTGLPVAAWHNDLADSTVQRDFPRPAVHLLAGLPEVASRDLWRASAPCWAAGVKASLRVTAADGTFSGTLSKLTDVLPFGESQAMRFRGKAARVSFADLTLKLHQTAKSRTCASEPLLRCVVRRVVDAGSGKCLAHTYLLANTTISATAEQLAQWLDWRADAEPYFKLLGQAQAQLAQGLPSDDELASLQCMWVAAQMVTTVLRLQHVSKPWAQDVRKMLTQLAGRAVRPGRAVAAPILLEGLNKFLLLLEALQTHDAAASPTPLRAAVHH